MKAIIRKERKFIRREIAKRSYPGQPVSREDMFHEIETSIYFLGLRVYNKKELSVD